MGVICGAQNQGAFGLTWDCTLEPAHDGDHQARTLLGEVFRSWPRAENVTVTMEIPQEER